MRYSCSQSTFISAVNVNWRAVLRKQKTHFLELTRFHRFGCFPFSPVFSGSFLLFDKRWALPVFFPQALMRKVCAWHCILFRQRKYVLLCAILLSVCGNEAAQNRQTFDRQEWHYDILMCSAAGKYLSCLHFLFWRFWHFLGRATFFSKKVFLLNPHSHPRHPCFSQADVDRANRKQTESKAVITLALGPSRSFSITHHYLSFSLSN